MSELAELRRAAETAARLGGQILRERFHGPRTVNLKGSIDLVTDADQAAEQAVLAFLRAELPHHAIVAEESASGQAPTGLRWYVDPLDGTTNYAHQVPHFCTSVALWDQTRPIVGAVYQPLVDELYSAAAGEGAHLNGRKLETSRCPGLDRALIGTGFPYDVWSRPEAPTRLFMAALAKAQGIRRMGSAALDLAYVAAGHFDGYFELGLFAWDVAAGILLVTEAGGRASDLRGRAAMPNARQILVGAPAVHDQLLALFAPLIHDL